MPGQYATRRGAGGRLEKVPEDEQGELKAAAEGVAPPPPPPGPMPTPEDIAFVNGARGGRPLEPELPDPVLSPQPAAKAPAGNAPIPPSAKAAAGAAGVAKKIIPGAAALFLAQKAAESLSEKPSPVGSLEGGGTRQDESARLLQELVSIQQGISRFGAPVKDAVTTTAKDSRI